MSTLVFQLQAPLSSWGGTAIGEYRGSDSYPSESALLGLIAAALGIKREQEADCLTLAAGYGLAVGVLNAGSLLRDYHTAQVPSRSVLKGRPHRTRADELNVAKDDLSTILSTRDYRQGASCLVAIQALKAAPYTLNQLAEALQKPKFVLYLGRKSCPPSAPLWPQIYALPSAREAFDQYLADFEQSLNQAERWPRAVGLGKLEKICWGGAVQSGFDAPTMSVPRKDRLVSRQLWQFGDRVEHIRLMK